MQHHISVDFPRMNFTVEGKNVRVSNTLSPGQRIIYIFHLLHYLSAGPDFCVIEVLDQDRKKMKLTDIHFLHSYNVFCLDISEVRLNFKSRFLKSSAKVARSLD